LDLANKLIFDRNITIATFAEFGLYKKEAYEANLWAGKILAEHGVPVAYKSVSSANITGTGEGHVAKTEPGPR
jgi:hypothetical protein